MKRAGRCFDGAGRRRFALEEPRLAVACCRIRSCEGSAGRSFRRRRPAARVRLVACASQAAARVVCRMVRWRQPSAGRSLRVLKARSFGKHAVTPQALARAKIRAIAWRAAASPCEGPHVASLRKLRPERFGLAEVGSPQPSPGGGLHLTERLQLLPCGRTDCRSATKKTAESTSIDSAVPLCNALSYSSESER